MSIDAAKLAAVDWVATAHFGPSNDLKPATLAWQNG